jgi:Primase zinc finger
MSVNSGSQMVKLGVSADFAICKGKRKDGMACSMVINKYVPNVKLISCRPLGKCHILFHLMCPLTWKIHL